MMPSSTPRLRFRRAADFTALRLGRVALGYLALVMAIITLAPFRFQGTPAHGLTTIWTWPDLVMNVAMFVPFGFVYQLTRPRGAPMGWGRVVLWGALLSSAIELAQLFEAERYTSLFDIATNTLGAVVGAGLFTALTPHVEGHDAVETLALELPLMGLVYLLIPLGWLVGLGSDGDDRRVLLLLLTIVAGAILGTVHAAYVAVRRPAPWRWLAALPSGWVLVAVVPGARGAWDIVLAAVGVVMAVAWLRDRSTHRSVEAGARRFELPTLRLVLPIFAAYLAVSSLWPLDAATPVWQGTLALTLPGVQLSQTTVYRVLEHVAAFTLVGYISAELYGRDARRLTQTAPRLLLFTVTAAVLLEVARGFHPSYGASLLLLLLTLAASAFGAYVYLLQRDHIRALVKRRTLLAELAIRVVSVDHSASSIPGPAATSSWRPVFSRSSTTSPPCSTTSPP